jgi:hypothetical protein
MQQSYVLIPDDQFGDMMLGGQYQGVFLIKGYFSIL